MLTNKQCMTPEFIGDDVNNLKNALNYYIDLFQYSPVALETMDYSGLKKLFEKWKAEGIANLSLYFEETPTAIDQCHEAVSPEVISNHEFLKLYNVKTHEELCSEMFENVLTEDSFRGYVELFIALYSNQTRFTTTTIDRAVKGDLFHAEVTWSIPEKYKDTWELVLMSIIPIKRLSQ